MKPATRTAVDTVQQYVLDLIRRRALAVGDRVPSQRDLCGAVDTSKFPVQQAMERLVREGYLRVEGKKVFVNRELEAPRMTGGCLGLVYWPPDVDFYASTFYSGMVSGVKLGAERAGKSLLFRTCWRRGDHDPVPILKEIEADVEGVIVFDLLAEHEAALVETIRSYAKPCVVLAYDQLPADIDAVVFDNAATVRQGVEFLAGCGHRRIAMLSQEGRPQVLPKVSRAIERAFRASIEDCGADAKHCPAVRLPADRGAEGTAVFARMMKAPERPSAIFCLSDDLALAACQWARKCGLKVPRDLSVLGRFDLSGGERAAPPLTTLHMPLFEMGFRAVQRLLEKQRDRETGMDTACTIILPAKLVERASHKRL